MTHESEVMQRLIIEYEIAAKNRQYFLEGLLKEVGLLKAAIDAKDEEIRRLNTIVRMLSAGKEETGGAL